MHRICETSGASPVFQVVPGEIQGLPEVEENLDPLLAVSPDPWASPGTDEAGCVLRAASPQR